jgi:pyruvate dehydrogenase E2 component (dihydrolipoamide acetyltransferase)
VDFKLPQLAEGIDTADVAQVLVKVGDTIEAGQVVMELETDKAVMELPCPQGGKVGKVLVKSGDTVKTGQAILVIDAVAGGSAPAATSAAPAAATASTPSRNGGPATSTAAAPAPNRATSSASAVAELPVAAGPATRRLARELGVALAQVRGSGPGGRVTQEDVAKAYAARSGGGGGGISIPPLPDFSSYGPTSRVALSKLAKTAAANLSRAWQIIPHVTQHDLADITDTEAARKRYQDSVAKGGPKVTMTAVAMKAVVACLQEFPNFNSSFDSATNEIVVKDFFNIGIAVDTPNGLVVPVVRDVDQKTILELAVELTTIAEKARAGKLEIKDMQGGTFTITNLGGIGGTAFTPIVNYPEVAILGMSRSQNQLQLVGGAVHSRLMLPLSLSYDHRVINGADAARFTVKLSSLFADPFRLLIEC